MTYHGAARFWPKWVHWLPLALACPGLIGCEGPSRNRDPEMGLRIAESSVRGSAPPRSGGAEDAAAVVSGRPIPMSRLVPALLEASGGAILEELALDMLLEQEAQRLSVIISEEQTQRERELLLRQLSSATPDGDAEAGERVLFELRASRGLGPVRFSALLRRTAMLRALVQPEVVITETALAQTHELMYGERRRARILTTETLAEATEAMAALRGGEPFGEVAARLSSDASAVRGGLVEAISAADVSYPAAIRTALSRLRPGELSPPVAIEGGYAILLLEQILPGDGRPMHERRAEIEEQTRLRQERVLMDMLADRLLRGATITPLEGGLRRSWDLRLSERERATRR